jgi:hypothetical protein
MNTTNLGRLSFKIVDTITGEYYELINTLLSIKSRDLLLFHVKWFHCHHDVARSFVADGGEGLQIGDSCEYVELAAADS